MSRPIKVPEALYEELRQEADHDGGTVMDALQRRLRENEAERQRLQGDRTALEKELRAVRSELARVAASHGARDGELTRLRGEAKKLGESIRRRDATIAELTAAVAEEMAEAEVRQSERDKAEREATQQRHVLVAIAVLLGIGCAWMAWKWSKRQSAVRVTDPTEPAPLQPTRSMGM